MHNANNADRDSGFNIFGAVFCTFACAAFALAATASSQTDRAGISVETGFFMGCSIGSLLSACALSICERRNMTRQMTAVPANLSIVATNGGYGSTQQLLIEDAAQPSNIV